MNAWVYASRMTTPRELAISARDTLAQSPATRPLSIVLSYALEVEARVSKLERGLELVAEHVKRLEDAAAHRKPRLVSKPTDPSADAAKTR